MNPTKATANDPDVINLSKAIIQHESAGNPKIKGKSDEYGLAQWQEPTWNSEAEEYLGYVPKWGTDEMTPEIQKAVLASKVADRKNKGYNPAQIAAEHNSGSKDGWENKVGTNKYGVKYDVPAYVKSVTDLYQGYKGGGAAPAPQPTSGYSIQPKFTPKQEPTNSTEATESSEGIGSKLQHRLNEGATALSDAAQRKINPVSGILQTLGAGAGAVTDVVGAGISAITPDFIEKPIKSLVGKGIQKVAETKAGQAITKGVSKFSEEHPELSKDIAAVGNIAGLIPAVKGISLAKGAITKGIGNMLGKDALSGIVSDISPTLTAKSGAKAIAKQGTTKSLIKGQINEVADPVLRETAQVIDENIPKFNKLNTYSEKVESVKGAIKGLAKDLRDNLTKEEINPIMTPDDLMSLDKMLKTSIAQNPVLVGNPGKQAQLIFDQFKRFLPKGRDITMTDVLDARQKLDSWIETIKPKAFDPATENALSVGLRAVRQGANDLMDRRSPSANVKQLLKKQSLLYRAMDNLSEKAAKELGSTRLSRFAKKHPKTSGLLKGTGKVALTATGTALGIGGIKGLLGN